MCAPVSVTTLHAVLTTNLLQAWYVSQVLGAVGTVAAVLLSFRNSLINIVKVKLPKLVTGFVTLVRSLRIR